MKKTIHPLRTRPRRRGRNFRRTGHSRGRGLIIEAARMSTQKAFQGWGPKVTGIPCHANGEPSGGPRDVLPSFLAEVWDKRGRPKNQDATNPWRDVREEEGDEKLLKYLYENHHSTPFEFAGLIIEVQAPIFVYREWHRHRTQSYGEMSARYAPVPDQHYLPTPDRCMMNAPTAMLEPSGRFASLRTLSERFSSKRVSQDFCAWVRKGLLKMSDKAKRNPVNFRYDLLDPDFLRMMAEIAHLGATKYGDFNYMKSRLDGANSPINHLLEHVLMFQRGEKHDHFDTVEHQLAAAAFNAMMEFYYHRKFGPKLYPIASPKEEPVYVRHMKSVFGEAGRAAHGPVLRDGSVFILLGGKVIGRSPSDHDGSLVVRSLNGDRFATTIAKAYASVVNDKYVVMVEDPTARILVTFDDPEYPGEAEPNRTRAEALARYLSGSLPE